MLHMKKLQEFLITANEAVNSSSHLLKLKADSCRLDDIKAGQFVQVAIGARGVMLRRPISVCNVTDDGELWLLVRRAGRGTEWITECPAGSTLNLMLPLGNGFGLIGSGRVMLIGGGVGVAPLLMLGRQLRNAGASPEFLLGARSSAEMALVDEFKKTGPVHLCTDDGTLGHHGVVTTHPVLSEAIDKIFCCGPAPMMKAVAHVARERAIDCEVSLENMMACGLGACLCCVEKTVRGNVCVCTEGPVFNIND